MEQTLDFISTAKRDFIEGDIKTKKRIFRAIDFERRKNQCRNEFLV